MRPHTRWYLMMVLMAAMLLVFLSGTQLRGQDQEVCPVTPKEPIDKGVFFDYEGKTYYFCCKRCRKKFMANPEMYAHKSLDSVPENAVKPPEAPHDHEHDHGTVMHGVERLALNLGKFHPVIVHFPIALILMGLFSEALLVFLKITPMEHVSRFCILMGALSALVAAILGWAAGWHASYPGELAGTLDSHRWLGTATAVFALATAYFNRRFHSGRQERDLKVYRVLLVASGGLVAVTGHFGAMLIYGLEHFSFS